MKRYIHYFIFFIFLTGLASCGGKNKVSEGILSQPEMVSTLMEVYLAEQKIIALNLTSDSAKILFKKLNAKALESIHVQDSVLQKSLEYYQAHPKALEEIYSALVDTLNLREQRLVTKPAGI